MNVEAALSQPSTYRGPQAAVVVVGAGHAGCEAAAAAARLGVETLLLTTSLDALANCPCNPSIGGTAKGQLVREIDALGGLMAEIADRAAIQYRMLNQTKGPAVRSPRAQVDRRLYQAQMKAHLEQIPHLRLLQAEVSAILWEEERIQGVLTATGAVIEAQCVILATGTYLGGRVFIGEHNYPSGPDHQQPAIELVSSLKAAGLQLRRFKTGTPVRINARSLDTTQLEVQSEDEEPWRFSFARELQPEVDKCPARPCWLTWTTDETRQIILDNLHRSPLYGGAIEGVGPRYCPSIEDKIVRFPDKLRHQVFIEPMGLDTAELYLQGLSTSLPEDVQEALVHSLPGLESAVIQRYAYAIEYDCLDPLTLKNTLETRTLAGLYGAGQINGTSGYEEAAAQGLIAGINAAMACLGRPPIVLGRDQAYIGVLIDDLVYKGTQEPYRMMTSRAEYRLLLRQDNADARLTPLGYTLGLISQERYEAFLTKQKAIEAEVLRLQQTKVAATPESAAFLTQQGTTPLVQSTTLAQLLVRPELNYHSLAPLDPNRPDLPLTWAQQAEIQIIYAGYIALEQKRLERFQSLEKRSLPTTLDYSAIKGLRIEAQQKLNQLKPQNLGEASRISGVSPADVSVLMVYLSWQAGKGL